MALVLLTITISSLLCWVSGYLVNPAFLGFLTPFIFLLISIAPVIIFIVMLAGLRHLSNRNLKNYIACFIASIALVFLFSPYRPTSIDGFYYRLSKIDRQDYLAAAELVIAEAERMQLSSSSFNYPETKEHKNFVASLSGKNVLFTLSNWPIHVSKEADYVLFRWGSGLTGAYEVLITTSNKEPNWLDSNTHETKKIYDNVILLMD